MKINTTTYQNRGSGPAGWAALAILMMLGFQAAYSQAIHKNNIVRNNVLTSEKVANALDVMKPFTATGTDTYAITPGLNVYAGVLTYATGDIWTVTITNTNTSTTTSLNVQAEGAISLKDNEGNNFAVGALKPLATYSFVYSSTGPTFKMIGSSGSSGGGGSGWSVTGTTNLTGETTINTNGYSLGLGQDPAVGSKGIHLYDNSGGISTFITDTDQLDNLRYSWAEVRYQSVDLYHEKGNTQFHRITIDDDQILYRSGFGANLTSITQTPTSLVVATTGTVSLPAATSIGTVDATEISHVNGVTSALQSQLDLKAPLASPTFTGTPAAPTAAASTSSTQIATTAFVKDSSPKVLIIPISDEFSTMSTANIMTIYAPFAMTVTAVYASLNTAQSSGTLFTCTVKEAGVTILSTDITIDNSEVHSNTAETPPVISDSAIAQFAKIECRVSALGTGGVAGKVYIVGY